MEEDGIRLRSSRFRKEREATWKDLEQLVVRVEAKGIRSLTAAQLGKLPGLYRSTLSSLSVARSISLDRNLREYLETLATRAWLCVYGPQRPVKEVVGRILVETFPAAVRANLRFVVVAAALLIGGGVTGFALTSGDIEWYYSLMPEGLAGGRGPTSTTEFLRDGLYAGADGPLTAFAAQLFSNNSMVAILCFSLGFVLGIPTALLLFYNGLALGAFVALYHERGLAVDVWGWLLPHGVTELGAIVLGGAAGLMIGHAMLVGDRRPRSECLAARGREAGPIVFGTVVLLVLAAILEGFFRQMVTSVPIRYLVVGVTTVTWALYFSFAGRPRA